MLAKTLVKHVLWMKCNALPKNASSCCPKQINQYPCMFSICFKSNYLFCSSFEPYILVGLQQTMGLPCSSAAKNFVREGPVNDVVSYWRRLESNCSFRLISNSWKFIQSTSNILTSLFRGGPWPLRAHFGCATAPAMCITKASSLVRGTRAATSWYFRGVKWFQLVPNNHTCFWKFPEGNRPIAPLFADQHQTNQRQRKITKSLHRL